MKVIYIVILITIVFEQQKYSQHIYDPGIIRPEVLKTANKLTKYDRVEGVFVGMVGTVSKIYQIGKKLRIKATKQELIELSFHPNPIVRTYSFWGLAERKESGLLPVLLNHLNDTAKIEVMFADAIAYKKLCDFLIELVVPRYVFTADYLLQNKSLLTDEKKTILDSSVIFTDNNLEYTGRALLHSKPQMDYYNRIKTLSIRENLYAIVALSRYRNNEDTTLIKNSIYFPKPSDSYFNSFYYTFWAFSNFPNQCFENFTLKLVDSIITVDVDERNLETIYKAIASFRKPVFLKYLESNDVVLDYFSFLGMVEFYDPVYDSLMFNIWETRKIITTSGLNHLIKSDKPRSVSLIISTLQIENTFLEIPGMAFWLNTNYEQILTKMFDTLYSEDRSSAINILNDKLRKSEYSELRFYCKKAKNIVDSLITNTILKRLETDKKNTFESDDYWDLIEVLLSYNNPSIEVKLISALLSNEYAMTNTFRNKKDILERIEMVKRSMNYTKTMDEIEIKKYR